MLELSQVSDIRAGGLPKVNIHEIFCARFHAYFAITYNSFSQDARLLNQLAAKCNYNQQELDERSLTVCSGLDMVNINYLHVVCESSDQAKVSLTSIAFESHHREIANVENERARRMFLSRASSALRVGR